MAGSDHLSPQQFFHGTTREGLSEVLPATAHGRGVTFPHDTDRGHAYATSESNAWSYAEKAWHASGSGIPRVYQVEPMGHHEPDPSHDEHGRSRGTYDGDRRSTNGWKVLGEVAMPEHMGTPDEWR